MKKFLTYITHLLNSLAEARTATALAKLHRYDEAAKIMQVK